MSAGRTLAAVALLAAVSLTGCKKKPEVPDYGRPLPYGEQALRKITNPAELPDLTAAFTGRDADLLAAIDNSIAWYNKPSTQQFFPVNGISHTQAKASAIAFRHLLASSASAGAFQQAVREQFDTYTSVGWDNRGTVYYTGYYSPVFEASRTPTAEYRFPLYQRPPDLESDPVTGKVLGRRTASGLSPYPTRSQIEQMGPAALGLAGRELVWLKDKLDAYLIHVNGSAKLRLPDGQFLYVGFAGTNGHEYTSVGRMLVKEGKIPANRLGLPTIREYFRQRPAELDRYLLRNDRYVFFKEYAPDNWPAGSLGVRVTPWRSIATDKDIFPRAAVTLIRTTVPAAGYAQGRRYDAFATDQDTGGAIRAAGRADIYMGVGPSAEQIAGRQAAEGRLYYFFLKPQYLARWTAAPAAAQPPPLAPSSDSPSPPPFDK